MCRVLRRKLIKTRKPRVCEDCGRPIGAGEECVKTEYAEPQAGSSRESIRAEFSCCTVQRFRPVNWYNGPCVWRPHLKLTADRFRVA